MRIGEKVYQKEYRFNNGMKAKGQITCFKENGDYVIEIIKPRLLLVATKHSSKAHAELDFNKYVKKIEDKNRANAYFKKVSEGYERIGG